MVNSTRFKEWFNDFYYVSSEYFYISIITISILLGLLIGGVWYGYRWYTTHKSYHVYELLDQCAKEFNYATQQNQSKDWESAQKFCSSNYQSNQSHAQAPYFLAFEAEALIQQGDRAQAVVVLDTMLGQLSPQSPIYYLYATKRALLLFDLDGEQAAVKELTALAADKNNAYSDYAAYQLGYYYWVRNDIEKARSVWKDLIERERLLDDMLPDDERKVSPWALLAKSKLSNLSFSDQQGAA